MEAQKSNKVWEPELPQSFGVIDLISSRAMMRLIQFQDTVSAL